MNIHIVFVDDSEQEIKAVDFNLTPELLVVKAPPSKYLFPMRNIKGIEIEE